MREPENDRERLLADRIDAKAKALLEGDAKWEDEILRFSHPYDSLTPKEQSFVDERTMEWKYHILNRK